MLLPLCPRSVALSFSGCASCANFLGTLCPLSCSLGLPDTLSLGSLCRGLLALLLTYLLLSLLLLQSLLLTALLLLERGRTRDQHAAGQSAADGRTVEPTDPPGLSLLGTLLPRLSGLCRLGLPRCTSFLGATDALLALLLLLLPALRLHAGALLLLGLAICLALLGVSNLGLAQRTHSLLLLLASRPRFLGTPSTFLLRLLALQAALLGQCCTLLTLLLLLLPALLGRGSTLLTRPLLLGTLLRTALRLLIGR